MTCHLGLARLGTPKRLIDTHSLQSPPAFQWSLYWIRESASSMVLFIAVARTPIRTSNHAKTTNVGAAWHSRFRGNMTSKEESMTGVK